MPCEETGHCFEWADIKQDLKALQEIVIEEQGKSLVIRSKCKGTCGKVFQAVRVAIPPTRGVQNVWQQRVKLLGVRRSR